jgi:hypothetical protein
MSETPLYRHDCDACQFLGRWNNQDLYYCDGEPTVIARRSDDGPDYTSGLCFANGAVPSLTEAKRRAIAAGLLQ